MSTTTITEARAAYTDETALQAELAEWTQLNHWLEKGKAKEMEMRRKLAKYLFADKLQENGELPEGTSKGTFTAGTLRFKAKVVGKMNHKVLEELRQTTMEQAQLSADQAKALLKVQYDLSLTTYKALSDEQKKIIDHMIQIKPGAPELSIEMVTE